jgi:hypothetical protein
MTLYRAEKDSMRVERDLLNFLAHFASPNFQRAKDRIEKDTALKVFKISIEVEQIDPSL